ncbi:IS21 family transposase [Planctomycetota bacterium]
MEQWAAIRRRVLVEGVSKRQVLRETGMHWTTLEKILSHSKPPGYRLRQARRKPKLGAFLPRIRQILEDDKAVHRKQRHTAKRIFERLREEGYTGGYTQVKAAVREIKQRSREVFVPLVHRPGEAQVDFGYALAKVDGVLRKVVLFVMALPHSDAMFVQVFERICTEVFWEGHRRAFAWLGGVPWRITYDNEGILVSKVLGGRDRKLTDGFLQLQSHYLFAEHFCRVGRPNEKGVVEGTVKYARLNFLVPVPQVRDLDELNTELVSRCTEELGRTLRGKGATKAALLEEDRAVFLELPAAPFDACTRDSTIASSLSLVRFDDNDYSVPVRYAHHPVLAKGYVDRVDVCFKDKRIATHERLWGKGGVSFEPVHYLALLEQKPGALDHARPLEGWELPECFAVLRRRLEATEEREGDGTREYIRVLRLLEKHSLRTLSRAVERGLRMNALTRDAIAQFLVPREDWRATTFRLDGRDHLRGVKVAQTDVTAYAALLAMGGAR